MPKNEPFNVSFDFDDDEFPDLDDQPDHAIHEDEDDGFVELTPDEYRDLMSNPAPPKRSMKQTTGYALGGFTLGTALAGIMVWILAQLGVDAAEIEQPLAFVIQAIGVAFGGWAAPPTQQVTPE